MTRPRIRTVKPELWQSRDFQALSVLGRLTFMSLISNADDEGRLATDAGHIAANFMVGCLPDEVASQLQRMEDRRMVVAYQHRARRFVAVRDYTGDAAWSQRIDHPTPSTLPAPPKFKRQIGISAPNKSGGSRTQGQVELAALANTREDSRRNGVDRIPTGVEPPVGPPVGEADALVLVPPVSLMPADQVFGAWQQMWHPTAKLTRERRTKIEARLREGWSTEDLIEAVTTGAANDPWAERHLALNDDIKNLLRNGSAVEKFLGLARQPLSLLPPAKRTLAQTYREQAAALRARGD